MYDLGRKFDEGLGVATDEQQAFQWYSRAAARGHAESMNRLGILYAQGRGVPQDYVAALAWYREAAVRGSLTAVSNAATLYFYGLGVALEVILLALILRYAWTWPRTAPTMPTMAPSPDREVVRAQQQA